MEDCVFCKIIGGKISADKVLENKDFIVIKDINQETKGHSLVIPKKHFETFLDLSSGLYAEFMKTTKEATEKILASVGKKAFNLEMNNLREAGQIVPHVHLHIIPRG